VSQRRVIEITLYWTSFSILYLNKNSRHFENWLCIYHEMDIKNMSRSVLDPLGLDNISPQTGFFPKPQYAYTVN